MEIAPSCPRCRDQRDLVAQARQSGGYASAPVTGLTGGRSMRSRRARERYRPSRRRSQSGRRSALPAEPLRIQAAAHEQVRVGRSQVSAFFLARSYG